MVYTGACSDPDMEIHSAELVNEREDPNSIYDNVLGIPLGHTFLDIKEIA